MDKAVLAFNNGTQIYQKTLTDLGDALEAEKQELEKDRNEFAQEQERFAAEVNRVEQVHNVYRWCYTSRPPRYSRTVITMCLHLSSLLPVPSSAPPGSSLHGSFNIHIFQ